MTALRTMVIELLRLMKATNFAAQLEFFQDDFDALIQALKTINFL